MGFFWKHYFSYRSYWGDTQITRPWLNTQNEEGVFVVISLSRPGLLIGKEGKDINVIQNRLTEVFGRDTSISIQEVNDSLYNLKSDNEKLENNIKAYNIQDKDYKLSQAKYKTGVISKLDLLQQKEALLYMEQNVAASKLACSKRFWSG